MSDKSGRGQLEKKKAKMVGKKKNRCKKKIMRRTGEIYVDTDHIL